MSLFDLFPILTARPWVKICGVTRPEDAELAVELGATLVGVNFWPRSKRVIDPLRAREIVAAVRRRIPVVAVFVNEDPGRIEGLFDEVGFDLVQLHGNEPEEVVTRFGPRALRALRAQPGEAAAALELPMKGKGESVGPSGGGAAASVGAAGDRASATRPTDSFQQRASSTLVGLEGCFALLIDGPAGERYGGTGEGWDWSMSAPLVAALAVPVLIAGGIRPETAAAALSGSGAAGVDVASGVEASPGVKDPEKMRRLMEAVERRRRGAE